MYRVFYDRLVDNADRTWMYKKLKVLCKQHFKEDFATVFKHLATQSQPSEDDMRSLMFGDYLKPEAVCLFCKQQQYHRLRILHSIQWSYDNHWGYF